MDRVLLHSKIFSSIRMDKFPSLIFFFHFFSLVGGVVIVSTGSPRPKFADFEVITDGLLTVHVKLN